MVKSELIFCNYCDVIVNYIEDLYPFSHLKESNLVSLSL